MSQNAPPMVLELIGPGTRNMPYCATCCMLYIGTVSADPEVQESARRTVHHALENKQETVDFHLPKVWHKVVRLSVTVAWSVIFPVEHGYPPMPVCWSHIQGYAPGDAANATVANQLIIGKDFRSRSKEHGASQS